MMDQVIDLLLASPIRDKVLAEVRERHAKTVAWRDQNYAGLADWWASSSKEVGQVITRLHEWCEHPEDRLQHLIAYLALGYIGDISDDFYRRVQERVEGDSP